MVSKKNFSIGIRQEQVLECFWDAGGSITVPEIMEQMDKRFGFPLSKSAVNTMIQALSKKGLVELEEKRRYAYLYRVTITREEMQTAEIRQLQNLLFGGSAKAMLVGLLKANADSEDLAEARKILQEQQHE